MPTATIRSLLTQLQSGLEPMLASDRLNNLAHLRSKIEQLRTQINALLKEISELETENAWRLATSVTDKEAYFAEQERALAEIRDTLEVQVKHGTRDPRRVRRSVREAAHNIIMTTLYPL